MNKNTTEAAPPPLPETHPEASRTCAFVLGTTSAAIGATVAGPVGAIAGALVGAVAGGLTGKTIDQALDPHIDIDQEEAYWRDHHSAQPYSANNHAAFEDYLPAYRVAVHGFAAHALNLRSFEEVEPKLLQNYLDAIPSLPWQQARPAAYAAWLRLTELTELNDMLNASEPPQPPPLDSDQRPPAV